MQHEETDYKKVFIRNSPCNPAMLSQRAQELIEIKQTADAIIELVEKGVTDVRHLIDKARGRHSVAGTDGDPSAATADAFHGRNMYQPLSDEDVIDLQGKDNRELIQL